jgi:cell wall-associated NlpC family hydrolase
MIDRLERYVDPEFVYRFSQGPNKAPSEAEARRKGINCVTLAHLALRELFDQTLPTSLHCYEMATDNDYFETIESLDLMQRGDLIWFGYANPHQSIEDFEPSYDNEGYLLNWRDSPIKHVAIYTGEQRDDDFMMLHSTHIEGTNTIWPLSLFAHYKRYEKIYRIGRLQTSSVQPTRIELL